MDQMHFYNFSFTDLLNHHICLCMKNSLYSFISAHSSIKMAIHNRYAVSADLQNMTKCYIYINFYILVVSEILKHFGTTVETLQLHSSNEAVKLQELLTKRYDMCFIHGFLSRKSWGFSVCLYSLLAVLHEFT